MVQLLIVLGPTQRVTVHNTFNCPGLIPNGWFVYHGHSLRIINSVIFALHHHHHNRHPQHCNTGDDKEFSNLLNGNATELLSQVSCELEYPPPDHHCTLTNITNAHSRCIRYSAAPVQKYSNPQALVSGSSQKRKDVVEELHNPLRGLILRSALPRNNDLSFPFTVACTRSR